MLMQSILDGECSILLPDGMEEAYLGLTEVAGIVYPVYSTNRAVTILMERDGMTEEDAIEFMNFNVLSIQPRLDYASPIWVDDLMDPEDQLEVLLDRNNYEQDPDEDDAQVDLPFPKH